MESGHLSRRDAVALCFSYQHLRGAPLNDQCCIDLVLVAPFGAEAQERYLEELLEDDGAISYTPPADPREAYDVVVIAFKIFGETTLVMKPLREYLETLAPLYGVAKYAFVTSNVLHTGERVINLN